MLEVLYHHAKFAGARISPAAGVAKNVEFFYLSVCLSVCLFVRHAFERHTDCAPDFAMKALEYTETILIPLDRGRFVVMYPCSTVSDCCQLATPLDAEFQKRQNWGFPQP